MLVWSIQKRGLPGSVMFDDDACSSQSFRPASGDVVRVPVGVDHSCDSGGDDGFAAGTGSSRVVAGFERDVEVATDGLPAGALECDGFGMGSSASLVMSLCNEVPFRVGDDAAHHWIGFHVAMPSKRDSRRSVEQSLRHHVFEVSCHEFSL